VKLEDGLLGAIKIEFNPPYPSNIERGVQSICTPIIISAGIDHLKLIPINPICELIVYFIGSGVRIVGHRGGCFTPVIKGTAKINL